MKCRVGPCERRRAHILFLRRRTFRNSSPRPRERVIFGDITEITTSSLTATDADGHQTLTLICLH